MAKIESKYTFEAFKNGKGFRIFRLKEHVVTVAYLDGGFKVWGNGYNKYTNPNNIFCFRTIIDKVANLIFDKVRQPNKKSGWIKVKIGKALAKRIASHLKDIIAKLPEKVVKVSKRLFTVNFKNPRWFDDKFKDNEIIQIMKYRGAAYVYNYGLISEDCRRKDWRKCFGKLDKNQRETLNKLPGNISLALVCNRLHTTKLDKPVTNKTELLIKLCSYLADKNENLVLKSSKEEFKKAMKIYHSNLSIRKTKDVANFINEIAKLKHEVSNLVDLVLMGKQC